MCEYGPGKLMVQFADGTKEGRLAGWCICAGAWAPEKFRKQEEHGSVQSEGHS